MQRQSTAHGVDTVLIAHSIEPGREHFLPIRDNRFAVLNM
jgi:hypothetical protein